MVLYVTRNGCSSSRVQSAWIGVSSPSASPAPCARWTESSNMWDSRQVWHYVALSNDVTDIPCCTFMRCQSKLESTPPGEWFCTALYIVLQISYSCTNTFCAVEHRFGCHATDPGHSGDIDAIETWLIHWLIRMRLALKAAPELGFLIRFIDWRNTKSRNVV